MPKIMKISLSLFRHVKDLVKKGETKRKGLQREKGGLTERLTARNERAYSSGMLRGFLGDLLGVRGLGDLLGDIY